MVQRETGEEIGSFGLRLKVVIVWSCENGTAFTIKTPVPSGMTGLVVKTQTASGRNWASLPNSVKEYFNLGTKSSYKPEQYKVNVTFSGE